MINISIVDNADYNLSFRVRTGGWATGLTKTQYANRYGYYIDGVYYEGNVNVTTTGPYVNDTFTTAITWGFQHIDNIRLSKGFHNITMLSPTGGTIRLDYMTIITSKILPKYYGSPMDMNNTSQTWVWSNFTWQNSTVSAGTVVGWRIYYNDTSGNENVTDIMTFLVRPPVIPTPRPVEFVVSDLVVSPGEVEEGMEVTVTVTATNVGEEPGTYIVHLEVDGLPTEMAKVALEGGESTTITFNLTAAVGKYTVEVDGLRGGFTVLALPTVPFAWLRPAYIAGIMIIIASAAAMVFVLLRRRARADSIIGVKWF